MLPGLDGVLVGWSLRLCSVGSMCIACDVELLWLMSECAASTACFSTQHYRTQDCRTTLDVADAAAACAAVDEDDDMVRCDGCAIERFDDDVQIEINLTPLGSHCLKDSLLESI